MATPLAGEPADGVRRGVADDSDDDHRIDRVRAPGSGAPEERACERNPLLPEAHSVTDRLQLDS